MKYLKFIILFFLAFILFNSNIYGKEYYDIFYESIPIDNTYIIKLKGSIYKYQQLTMIKRVSDGHFAYCIKPGTNLNETVINGNDDLNIITHMSSKQIERIKLLAYYGYGYLNHTDIKWYSVTQFMIWQTYSSGYDIYFTDTLNGNIITRYASEIAELEDLISNHHTKPSFNKGYNIHIGQVLELTDENSVLDMYEILPNDNVEIVKNGNNLTIKALKEGSTVLKIIKKANLYSSLPIAYIDSYNQDIFMPGNYDVLETDIKVNVQSGKVQISKTGEKLVLDNNTFFYDEIKLDGAEFGIYSNDDKLIQKGITNELGIVMFTDLPLGKYYIKELKSNYDNIVDQNKYYIEVIDDDVIDIELKNKLPKGNLIFIKQDKKTLDPLSDTIIEIYTEDNKLIYEGKTDSLGKIEIKDLYIGKYYIIEKEAKEGYKKNNEEIWLEIINDEETLVTMLNESIDDKVIFEIPNTNIDRKYNFNELFILMMVLTYAKNKI